MDQQPLLPEVLAPVRDDAPPNRGGRPSNASNKKYRALQKVALSESLPIVQKLCALARDGDVLAAKVILDRVWPRPKAAPLGIDLAPTRTPAELRAAMHDMLAKIANGDIPAEDGAHLIAIMRDVLDSHRIQTFDGGLAEAGPAQADVREQLAQRLARVLEERERRAIAAAEPAE